MALALNFRLARMRVADGSDTAILLDASIGELAESLKELRDLARGIHPAVLSEHGLEPAVRALAARAPIPVEVVGHADRRLPAAVETAAYFVVSEALTNVSKYARAAHATVRVVRVDGQLAGRDRRRRRGRRERRRRLRAAGLVRPRRGAQRNARDLEPSRPGHAPARSDALHMSSLASGCRRTDRGFQASRGWPVRLAPLRVVVAEDSFLLRAGIVRVLEDAGFGVVAEARDADELLAEVRAHRPDVVVTDIRMPPTHTDEGLRATAVIRAELPDTGVVVLSQFVNERYAIQLLEHSTAGSATCSRTASWSRSASPTPSARSPRGGSALDPEVVAEMLDRRRASGPLAKLSPRELDVLAAMAEGRSNVTIATRPRNLRARTATPHRRLLAKLDIPADAVGHRRVLAVLTYLDAQDGNASDQPLPDVLGPPDDHQLPRKGKPACSAREWPRRSRRSRSRPSSRSPPPRIRQPAPPLSLCDEKPATIVGDENANVLIGQPGVDDVIVGLGGNDVIIGRSGNDTICAGDGDDRVRAGDGDDFVHGDDGNDTILSGDGADKVHGNQGDDEVRGQRGDDTFLHGDIGRDNVSGGEGQDDLFGGTDEDNLSGGPGVDFLHGGNENDRLSGGPGRDGLYGDDGNDLLRAGTGDDIRLYGQDGDDRLDGGPGTDSDCQGAPDADADGVPDVGADGVEDADQIRRCE